jgi:Ferritin-like
MASDKIHPRNRTARLAAARAAGNPVVTELESGVGNCFPGLEFDARNLDRRFFPYLVVDFGVSRRVSQTRVVGDIVVRAVELARAQTDGVTGALLTGLRTVATTQTRWRVARLNGTFAGFGARDLAVEDLDPTLEGPPDDWTAVRLLQPGTDVTLSLAGASGQRVTLTAPRASYLRDDGAFAEMFTPGELTQSLCSPWTHDFRDCGCFYWASNHPDIVSPAVPAPAAVDDPAFAARVSWLRRDRVASPPRPDFAHRNELRHHEINNRWQELDIVVDGREQRTPYAPDVVVGTPLPASQLVPTLRYAAGVELAVMLEYVAAAFSLNRDAGDDNSRLRQDVAVAHFEVMRVAQSEMRHLKAVNGLLLHQHQDSGVPGTFRPALGVATVIPGAGGTTVPSMNFRPLTSAVIADFVAIEAPSKSVDALYGRILATYQQAGRDTEAATVGQIMAEGADHFSTFKVISELLSPHPEGDYLLPVNIPAAGDATLATLQQRYETMLDHFFKGYSVGVPPGSTEIAAARSIMLGSRGVEGACEALAAQNVLPVFAVPTDGRFAPIAAPGA